MKIVAKMSDSSFLVEISDTEVANLYGKAHTYNLSESEKPRIGKTLPVSHIFNLSRALSEYNKGLESARGNLQSCLKNLEKAEIPFIPSDN